MERSIPCTQKYNCPAACCHGRFLLITQDEQTRCFPDAINLTKLTPKEEIPDFADAKIFLRGGKAAYVLYGEDVILANPSSGCPNLDPDSWVCNLVRINENNEIEDNRPKLCKQVPIGGKTCTEARHEYDLQPISDLTVLK